MQAHDKSCNSFYPRFNLFGLFYKNYIQVKERSQFHLFKLNRVAFSKKSQTRENSRQNTRRKAFLLWSQEAEGTLRCGTPLPKRFSVLGVGERVSDIENNRGIIFENLAFKGDGVHCLFFCLCLVSELSKKCLRERHMKGWFRKGERFLKRFLIVFG